MPTPWTCLLLAAALATGRDDAEPMQLEWDREGPTKVLVVAFAEARLPVAQLGSERIELLDRFVVTELPAEGAAREAPLAKVRPVGLPVERDGTLWVKKARLELATLPAAGSRFGVRLEDALAERVRAAGGAIESGEPLAAQAAAAEPEGDGALRLGRGMPRLSLTPRTADSASDFALDFDARWLALDLADLSGDGARKLALGLESRGTVKSDLFGSGGGERAQLNSIESELALRADLFRQRAGSDRQLQYASVDLHGGHESTQDFSPTTWDAGGGLAFNLGGLFPLDVQRWNVLDAAAQRRPVASPRFYAGYARVFQADATDRDVRTGDTGSSYDRIEGSAAWELPVFREGVHVRALWRGFLDLDADRDEFRQYVTATLEVDPAALGALASLAEAVADDSERPESGAWVFVLKYTGGGLPPEFGTEHSVSFGIQASF